MVWLLRPIWVTCLSDFSVDACRDRLVNEVVYMVWYWPGMAVVVGSVRLSVNCEYQ